MPSHISGGAQGMAIGWLVNPSFRWAQTKVMDWLFRIYLMTTAGGPAGRVRDSLQFRVKCHLETPSGQNDMSNTLFDDREPTKLTLKWDGEYGKHAC